jgi:PEP-CTERM motif-containing protein
MRRVVLMAVLVLALPIAAFANGIDFSNFGGTVSGSASGLTFTSTLIGVGPIGGPCAHCASDLGTVQITTGAITGSLLNGGTFASGTITITGNGTGGVSSGTLFQGTFTSATWTLQQTLPDGTHNYVFMANFSNGFTMQTVVSTGHGYMGGEASISSGDTTVNSVVPEPGTLGLLGTGMVGIAGVLRRKFRSV